MSSFENSSALFIYYIVAEAYYYDGVNRTEESQIRIGRRGKRETIQLVTVSLLLLKLYTLIEVSPFTTFLAVIFCTFAYFILSIFAVESIK